MILNPGVISLVTGSLVTAIIIVYASFLSIKIVRKWDINSRSSQQLSLERETYLASTVVNYLLWFEVFSLLLYIYTLEDIHDQIAGAMCVTGALNANPVGWYVLYTKITVLFMSFPWIALNSIDQKAEDYPLVRIKHLLLLMITPVILTDTHLVVRYFTGLRPDIISSCCGVMFSEGGEGMTNTLASIPPGPMIMLFYAIIFLFLINGILSLHFNNAAFQYGSTLMSIILLITSVASVISFISIYYYEIPTHHCPFDLIEKEYNFVGYPLYIVLFGGVICGSLVGMTAPLKKYDSVKALIIKKQKQWTVISLILISIFTLLSSWPLFFSDFKP